MRRGATVLECLMLEYEDEQIRALLKPIIHGRRVYALTADYILKGYGECSDARLLRLRQGAARLMATFSDH